MKYYALIYIITGYILSVVPKYNHFGHIVKKRQRMRTSNIKYLKIIFYEELVGVLIIIFWPLFLIALPYLIKIAKEYRRKEKQAYEDGQELLRRYAP